jgi:hypothetical protein
LTYLPFLHEEVSQAKLAGDERFFAVELNDSTILVYKLPSKLSQMVLEVAYSRPSLTSLVELWVATTF